MRRLQKLFIIGVKGRRKLNRDQLLFFDSPLLIIKKALSPDRRFLFSSPNAQLLWALSQNMLLLLHAPYESRIRSAAATQKIHAQSRHILHFACEILRSIPIGELVSG